MHTRIKICGVTRTGDAAQIAGAGADYIGLNFWPKSKRYLDPARGPEVAAAARAAGPAQLVGVFVNASPSEIAGVAERVPFDVIQLHGDETPDDAAELARTTGCAIWKAIAVRGPDAVAALDVWPTQAILLDTPSAGRGGAGVTFDWQLAQDARRLHPARSIVLAGGLDPENVGRAITAVAPWAVDVASGVESAPGVKDPARVTAFIAAARART